MIAGKDGLARGNPAARVPLLDYTGEILDDVGQAAFREHLPPQIVRFDAAGIGRIARAVVPSAIERQEPAFLPGKLAAHPDLTVIDCEVDGAAAGTKNKF